MLYLTPRTLKKQQTNENVSLKSVLFSPSSFLLHYMLFFFFSFVHFCNVYLKQKTKQNKTDEFRARDDIRGILGEKPERTASYSGRADPDASVILRAPGREGESRTRAVAVRVFHWSSITVSCRRVGDESISLVKHYGILSQSRRREYFIGRALRFPIAALVVRAFGWPSIAVLYRSVGLSNKMLSASRPSVFFPSC